jgi:hypothetical protein
VGRRMPNLPPNTETVTPQPSPKDLTKYYQRALDGAEPSA